MALIEDVKNRLWRTGSTTNANEIYALVNNDVTKPTRNDPLIGSMDTAELADHVVDIHNRLLSKFGRHYVRALRDE